MGSRSATDRDLHILLWMSAATHFYPGIYLYDRGDKLGSRRNTMPFNPGTFHGLYANYMHADGMTDRRANLVFGYLRKKS